MWSCRLKIFLSIFLNIFMSFMSTFTFFFKRLFTYCLFKLLNVDLFMKPFMHLLFIYLFIYLLTYHFFVIQRFFTKFCTALGISPVTVFKIQQNLFKNHKKEVIAQYSLIPLECDQNLKAS